MNLKSISFYPGPSRVHDDIPAWVKEAHAKGILSMNHRSTEFVALSKKTISLLKQKLKVPKAYSVFFMSSATECWETIAQSLVVSKSIHLYNGAFGEKWFDYTRRLRPDATAIPFDIHHELAVNDLRVKDDELICLTQNETSNGTQVASKTIATIRKNNPSALLAIDATSSMAGIYLDFKAADIWFASVQKCFGLPAGLAIMICSPQAIARIENIGEKKHYNSLAFIKEMMDKWQTPFTPNVLGIYLLQKSLEKSPGINSVNKQTQKRFTAWQTFIGKSKSLSFLVKNRNALSKTVLTIQADETLLLALKTAAKKRGLLLGEGYGKLKTTTFRIANFPAIKDAEIKKLMSFLKSY